MGQNLDHVGFDLRLLVAPKRLGHLLLGQFVPLQLLHFRAGRDGQIFPSGQQRVEIGTKR